MRSFISIYFVLLFLLSCNSASRSVDSLEDLDLMKYGLPVKIKAPVDASVEFSDLGFVQDVTVKGDSSFYIQIIGGTATTTDIKKLKDKHLDDVQRSEFFGSLISEDDNGFIFQKKIGPDRINHDFRYIRLQGDMEYVFQTGLVGKYTLEDVNLMFEAVK